MSELSFIFMIVTIWIFFFLLRSISDDSKELEKDRLHYKWQQKKVKGK